MVVEPPVYVPYLALIPVDRQEIQHPVARSLRPQARAEWRAV